MPKRFLTKTLLNPGPTILRLSIAHTIAHQLSYNGNDDGSSQTGKHQILS